MSDTAQGRINWKAFIPVLEQYAVQHPTGFTLPEVAGDLQVSERAAQHGIRLLRRSLRSETMNVVCDPQGFQGRWLYRLVSGHDDAKDWERNRSSDMSSRLQTMEAVASSIENGTDPHTLDGQRAHVVHRTLGRLREDLRDLETWYEMDARA